MNTSDKPSHYRTIKSYVRRTGRVTQGQSKALASLSQYLIPYSNNIIDYKEVFHNKNPIILEIGFGMGEASAHIATIRPNDNFIGCEVHEPGVGALLKRIADHSLKNMRIISHDAVQVLENMIKLNSLHGVHIFFPDPWHKKRHNKRRLIQTPFVEKLIPYIQSGGYIHCATDWQPYAEQILEILNAQAQLKNTSVHTHGYADKPAYRPLTKFENRGIRLGHGVWDLVFEKV